MDPSESIIQKEVPDTGNVVFQENFEKPGEWKFDTSFQELFYPYETSLPSDPRPVIVENGILSLTSWVYWYPNEEVPADKIPPVPLRLQPSNLTINFETPIISATYRVDLKIIDLVAHHSYSIPASSIHGTRYSGGTYIWVVLNGKKYDLIESYGSAFYRYENETLTYILDTNIGGENWSEEKNSFNIENHPNISNREGKADSSPCTFKIDKLRIAALN